MDMWRNLFESWDVFFLNLGFAFNEPFPGARRVTGGDVHALETSNTPKTPKPTSEGKETDLER